MLLGFNPPIEGEASLFFQRLEELAGPLPRVLPVPSDGGRELESSPVLAPLGAENQAYYSAAKFAKLDPLATRLAACCCFCLPRKIDDPTTCC